MTNLYHDIELKAQGEQKLSISNTLDRWGSNLIRPFKTVYGGHSFTLEASTNTIVQHPDSSLDVFIPMNILEKLKVKIGLVLKRIAVFFDSRIEAKYQLVDAKEEDKTKLWSKLKGEPNVTAEKSGNRHRYRIGGDLSALIDCLAISCFFCMIFAEPRPMYYYTPYPRYYW